MTKTPEQMAEEYINHVLESQCDCSYRIAFVAGYQAAKNSPEKQDSCEHILDMEKMVDVNSSSGWISVKDRLPEEGQDVLVWYHNSYDVACLQKVKPVKLQPPQFNNIEMFEWCFYDFEDVDVTYWQPLPAPPKEEK